MFSLFANTLCPPVNKLFLLVTKFSLYIPPYIPHIRHESKQFEIRCLVQWHSQEGQDVGHGHKPREGNIWGKIYTEFCDWKKKLVDRWTKYIGKQEDHVEKWSFSF